MSRALFCSLCSNCISGELFIILYHIICSRLKLSATHFGKLAFAALLIKTRCLFLSRLGTTDDTTMLRPPKSCWQCLCPSSFPWQDKGFEKQNCNLKLSLKTPNIFCRNLGDQLVNYIQSLLDSSLYTVYSLSDADWNSNVWQSSTNFLILSNSSSHINQITEIHKVSYLETVSPRCLRRLINLLLNMVEKPC